MVHFTGSHHYDVVQIPQSKIPAALERRIEEFILRSADFGVANVYPANFTDNVSCVSNSIGNARANTMIATHARDRKNDGKSETAVLRKLQKDLNNKEYGAGYLLAYIFTFVSLICYIMNA